MKKDIKNISGLLVRAKFWRVPEEVLKKILIRDKNCVYCHIKTKIHQSSIGTPKDKKTIEHFSEKYVHSPLEADVGICCGSCNSSKGNKKLSTWFKTKYCLNNNINEKTVARPVKDYIGKRKKI